MAYTLTSALAKEKGYGKKWATVDALGSLTIQALYDKYSSLILTLSNSLINHPVYFDLLAHRNLFVNTALTLNQWLINNGNTTLPTSDTAPSVTDTYVLYRDAWRANYSITRVPPTGSPTSQALESEKTDMLLTRPGIDYLDMANKCLVSVNGMIHRTEGSVDGLYVRKGASSAVVANGGQVGILSFASVGSFTILPITSGMIYKQNVDQQYYQGAYINTGVDLTNKTPIVVIGGHMHLADNLYKVVGDKEIYIDVAKLMIPQRLFAANKIMDIGTMRDYMDTDSNDRMALSDLRSDDFIVDYLTMSQSFIVLLNTGGIFVEKQHCESCDLAGTFISEIEPIYPMVTNLGRLENYWPIKSFDRYVLHCVDNLRTRYRFESTDWWNDLYVENVEETLRPYEYSKGFFMKIGKETLTFS